MSLIGKLSAVQLYYKSGKNIFKNVTLSYILRSFWLRNFNFTSLETWSTGKGEQIHDYVSALNDIVRDFNFLITFVLTDKIISTSLLSTFFLRIVS